MLIFPIIEENTRKLFMKAIRKKFCSALLKEMLLMMLQNY